MTEDQIKHLVNRFLSWKLPENFNPDGGISFKPAFNEHTAHPMRHEPSGTNLFDYVQAEAMVRHMIEGLPLERSPTSNRYISLHGAIRLLRPNLNGVVVVSLSPDEFADLLTALSVAGSNGDQFAWLIEAPGHRYLRSRFIAHCYDFAWTKDANAALRFVSREQADETRGAIRAMFPHLFGFETTLGDAKAVEHGWIQR